MDAKILFNEKQLQLTLQRIARELLENHGDFSESVLIGLQPRGTHFAKRLANELEKLVPDPIKVGALDTTFHRDDFRRTDAPISPSKTEINFFIEEKRVILVDDVLYTGRSVRAGMDAMLSFGRPKSVDLAVLIDRRFSRDLPIQANYVGQRVDSIRKQRVSVEWKEAEGKDEVKLFHI
jgi:pyrimidine operon attenuation protein/uracil phosphoribosyltransferase